jgi:hypothetical protein
LTKEVLTVVENKRRLCVLWTSLDQLVEGKVNYVARCPVRGPICVFTSTTLPKFLRGCPVVVSKEELVVHVRHRPGQPCLVPVEVAVGVLGANLSEFETDPNEVTINGTAGGRVKGGRRVGTRVPVRKADG